MYESSTWRPVLGRLRLSLFGLGAILLCVPSAAAPTQPRTRGLSLTVQVTGLRNDQGKVSIALFQTAEGFPDRPERALRGVSGMIERGTSQVTFAQLPSGTYAVSVLHDENANGKLDTNLLGIPTEGFGVSNNPAPAMAPPSFDSARFLVDSVDQRIAVRIRY